MSGFLTGLGVAVVFSAFVIGWVLICLDPARARRLGRWLRSRGSRRRRWREAARLIEEVIGCCPGCNVPLHDVYCQRCGWNRNPAWNDLPD